MSLYQDDIRSYEINKKFVLDKFNHIGGSIYYISTKKFDTSMDLPTANHKLPTEILLIHIFIIT